MRGTCYVVDRREEGASLIECAPLKSWATAGVRQGLRLQYNPATFSDVALAQRHGKRYLVQIRPLDHCQSRA